MDLTEQHRSLLQAASERDDGRLPRPEKLAGAALRRMADRLLAAGVAETSPAGQGEASWFRGAEGEPTTLRITDAGRRLVAGSPRPIDVAPERTKSEGAHGEAARPRARTPRRGTKRTLLLEMLGRDGGATIATLSNALVWQAHTVRAALTRLRQDGVAIDRAPGEGGTTYRVLRHSAPETQVDAGADA